jgi:hypothetical protein
VTLWQVEEMQRLAGLDQYLESDESTEPDTNEWKMVEPKLGMRHRKKKTKDPTVGSYTTKCLVRRVPDHTCERGKMAEVAETKPRCQRKHQTLSLFAAFDIHS